MMDRDELCERLEHYAKWCDERMGVYADHFPLREAATRIQALIDENARLREAIEQVWREGFQSARECLSDDEAFVLTDDVESDLWLDSRARAALSPNPD